jgi:hypothetical protein
MGDVFLDYRWFFRFAYYSYWSVELTRWSGGEGEDAQPRPIHMTVAVLLMLLASDSLFQNLGDELIGPDLQFIN